MRTIRRHRLDDPRITDEVRAVLVAQRPSKASFSSHDDDCYRASTLCDPLAVSAAIRSIREQVCEHFYMREMRDPELTVRSNRRAYVLPRQIAVYIARQLTGASLQEIGREFGGRHHTTVLHSIDKIDKMRRSDKALDRTIRRLIYASVKPCA